MPLIFLAYVALLVGSAVGGSLGRAEVWIAGGGVALTAIGLYRARRAAHAGIALTLAASTLAAHAEARDRSACRDGATRDGRLAVVVEADVHATGRTAARAVGCRLPVTISVAHGRARAGDVVGASGVALATSRGVQLRDATLTPSGARSALVAWRAGVARRIDALFGEDAPLVRALVVADAHDVDVSARDRFADAGLVHLLSVSGLHVSIVAEALTLLLGACRLSRRAAQVASVVGVVGYVAVIGAPAPAVRAATMLAAQLASRLVQRPTSPWAILALGGTVPLLRDPLGAADLGYQLSMAGMAALVGGRALTGRLGVGSLGGWRRTLARELVTSLVATAVTAPIVAWCFGRVSIIGPLANLAAAPVVALLQPTLFLAVLLSPLGPVAQHVAGAAHLLIAALDRVASAASLVPHASLAVAPTAAVAVIAALASLALLTACVARDTSTRSRARLASAAGVVAMVVAPLLPARSTGALELHMLDAGQGDAVAVRTPHGRWVVVDAGRSWRGGDGGRATVVPYLRRRGGAVDAFILSHAHADHAGGAATVLRMLRPAHYWDAAFALPSDVYRASLVAARESHVAWRRVRPSDTLVVDGVTFRVLAPDSAWTAGLRDANLASVIVSVRVARYAPPADRRRRGGGRAVAGRAREG